MYIRIHYIMKLSFEKVDNLRILKGRTRPIDDSQGTLTSARAFWKFDLRYEIKTHDIT